MSFYSDAKRAKGGQQSYKERGDGIIERLYRQGHTKPGGTRKYPLYVGHISAAALNMKKEVYYSVYPVGNDEQ